MDIQVGRILEAEVVVPSRDTGLGGEEGHISTQEADREEVGIGSQQDLSCRCFVQLDLSLGF